MSHVPGAFKFHGAKSYLQRAIWEHAPLFTTFVDGFGGSGVVGLNCPPGHKQIYIEKNRGRYCVFATLQSGPSYFIDALKKLDCCKATFNKWSHEDHPFTFDAAVSTMVKHQMSIGGAGRAFSWSPRERRGRNETLSAWESKIEVLPAIADRIKGWEIWCMSFLDWYRQQILNPSFFIYLDPPYPSFTRTMGGEYGDDEMSIAEHEELLLAVKDSEAQIMISTYPNWLYDKHLTGKWRRIDIRIKNHSSMRDIKATRTERLYVNY